MLKSRHLRSAASLPCLLALLGLSACELTPHRIDADSTRQANGAYQADPKSYAQIIAQQQRTAAPRVALPATATDSSRPASGARSAPPAIPAPPQQQPAPPAAARPAPAPASPDAGQLGKQAMLSASNDVLATRLRDQPAPPAAVAAPSPAPAAPPQAAVAAAATTPAKEPPPTAASSIPEPPVVPVMRGDQEIRIPPAKPAAAAAAPSPPPAAAPAPATVAAAAPAAPAPVKAETPPRQAGSRSARAASPLQAASVPASTPVPTAAEGNGSALYGMPLPNLPALQNPDEVSKAQLAQTQLARADSSAAPQPAAAASGADRSAEAAQAELKEAQNRIGLSDEQLQQLQAAQDRIAKGDNGGAFLILESLNAQLQSETRSYVVQDNESMWHVAGQPEVYGNSYLWPLVWQANRDRVKKPSQLRRGLKLIIPAHPTAQEVAEALAYSKANNLEGMNQADSQ